jgi:hypothetical protein
MTIKAGIREFLWMLSGALIFFIIALAAVHFQTKSGPAEQLAFKAVKLNLVNQLRADLTASSEAEKSAVMAVTDDASRTFAGQSHASSSAAQRDAKELEEQFTAGGTRSEKDTLARFSKAFIELKKTDAILLDLAVKNTNLKAYSLAFGPAADAMKDMDTALSKLVEKSAGSAGAANVSVLAFGAQTAALSIQTMLAPHIAEENNKKMDEMEASMAKYDKQVCMNLNALALLPKISDAPDFVKAASDYERFSKIRKEIIVLSRENTNVRSLAMSLGEKRKIFLNCQDILSELQQAIEDEPVPGVNSAQPINPRHLEGEGTR